MIHSRTVRASVRPVQMLGHRMLYLSSIYLDILQTKDYRNTWEPVGMDMRMGMEEDRQHPQTRLVRSMKPEPTCSRMVKHPHDPLVPPISIYD